MKIVQLNLDCLLQIFEQLTLQEQILYLRPVCQQWNDIVQETICTAKRSLQLFPSFEAVQLYSKASKYNSKLVIYNRKLSFLQANFPNISKLTIYFDYQNYFPDLPELLSKYPSSLTQLTLIGHIKPCSSFTLSLCKSLNSLSNLTRLDLQVKNLFTAENYTEISLKIIQPIVAQLEHFSYSDYTGDIECLAFKHLKSLTLEHIAHKLPDLHNFYPNICFQITHLHLSELDSKMLHFIKQKFVNLKFLTIRNVE